MLEEYVHALGRFLQTHPNWGGLMTFMIAFLESLPLIGTIIPGSVTMTIVGMLIGTGILPFWGTLFWATIGAFLGDWLGYWIGGHYKEGLRKMWPFKKRPQWLEAGETFFHKHGGKSILIGRFFGPLRSIIPMIAGLLHMRWLRFIIADILAAGVWAFTFMLPGILLGTLSLQLPPNVATKFILILIAFIILLSFCAWLLNFFSSQLKKTTNQFLKYFWRYLQSHQRYDGLTRIISRQDHHDDHHQLGWLFLGTLCFVLFGFTALTVIQHSGFTLFNKPIFEFLRSIRTSKIDLLMIAITLLGDGRALLLSTLLILAWLWRGKNKRAAVHWLIAIGMGYLIPNIFKFFFYFPRPTGLLHASSTSSFPSGHTFLSVMYYGFLSILIACHIEPKYRRYPYYVATTIVLLVAFSRLYLGAHWLSDVLASITLGLCFLSLVTLSYRRKKDLMNVLNFTLFVSIATLTIWLTYFALSYQKNVARYSLNWPSQVIDEQVWWGKLNPALPIFRQNRLGNPAEPMNLQFSGNVGQLQSMLAAKQWVGTPALTLFKTTVQKLSQTPSNGTTLLPSLYLNKPPVLFMTKNQGKNKLILKLWRSNVYLSETWDILYIGNVIEYQIEPNTKKIVYSYNVINKLMVFLNSRDWRMKTINASQIPFKLFEQKWDGKILQLSAPTLY